LECLLSGYLFIVLLKFNEFRYHRAQRGIGLEEKKDGKRKKSIWSRRKSPRKREKAGNEEHFEMK
jgi:hypothetical protein